MRANVPMSNSPERAEGPDAFLSTIDLSLAFGARRGFARTLRNESFGFAELYRGKAGFYAAAVSPPLLYRQRSL